MSKCRLFLSQETLEQWLGAGYAQIEGDWLSLHEPVASRIGCRVFQLRSAVHFLREVTGGSDPEGLVGRVKDMEQLRALMGDHCADSVIVGEHAYEVIEGFAGEPLTDQSFREVSAVVPTQRHSEPAAGEIDLLARFFLSSRQP